MKTKEIVEILYQEFEGKNYNITSNKELETTIEIPSGIDFKSSVDEIRNDIVLIKPRFPDVNDIEFTFSQNNYQVFTLGA